MNGQPIVFGIERPASFERTQLIIRLALLGVVGWVTHPIGLLWFAIPAVAAALIAQKGGRRYLDENGPTVVSALNWLLDLIAYLALLTDRLPGSDRHAVRFEVVRSGSPTAESALRRIVSAVPKVIGLALLTFFGGIVWVIAMIAVLVTGTYPESLWRFLHDIVQRQACLFAYLASLVASYPAAVEATPHFTHGDAEPA